MNNANETANGMMWNACGRFYRGFLQRFPTVFGCRLWQNRCLFKVFQRFRTTFQGLYSSIIHFLFIVEQIH